MIQEHIKIHDEPAPVIYGASDYHSISWQAKSVEQKKVWISLIESEYRKALTLYQVGDKVSLKTNPACVIEICSFEIDPEKVMSYRGLPCIIKGTIRTWNNPNEISYSIEELEFTSLVSHALPLMTGQNDDC